MFGDRRNETRRIDDRDPDKIPDHCVNEGDDRVKRFQKLLENRGCPLRMKYRESNDDIRWIG